MPPTGFVPARVPTMSPKAFPSHRHFRAWSHNATTWRLWRHGIVCCTRTSLPSFVRLARTHGRHPPPRPASSTLPPAEHVVLALATCLVLAACNDTQDLAPASPDTPWQIPASSAPSPSEIAPAANLPPVNVNPGHSYSLAELIDIAERRNQTTRIAWEQARQAAIGVGIA